MVQSHEPMVFTVKIPWRLREPWFGSWSTNKHAMVYSMVLDEARVDIASITQPTTVLAFMVNVMATHGTFHECTTICPMAGPMVRVP